MTLEEAYPYWILGDVPMEDLPFIACNDMLAGNNDDAIVAVAALLQPDAWELDRVLGHAFAKLRLPAMTKREAAKVVALDRMRDVCSRVVSREENLIRAANSIYWYASEAGLFSDDNDVDEQVAYYGVEFLQLADALEARQDNVVQRAQFEELIVEAAQALLRGNPVPDWYSDANSNLHRGKSPWKVSPELHQSEGEFS